MLRTSVDPSLIPKAALDLCARLESRGHGAWIVGGCVRDHLMQRPVADWDLATTAKPDELMQIFPRAIPTGIEHGTVTVMVDKVPYEVTTLRGETVYTDGRRPDAVYFVKDITEDLARRDFTINALAYQPHTNQLFDPFGGFEDLRRRLVRAVGNAHERFSEDGLRVLRAARFVATLEFELDTATKAAIAPTLDTYQKVSSERVRDEWLKTMKARQPSRAFRVMHETGILRVTYAPFEDLVGCTQNRYHQFDVWDHTMHALDNVPAGDPILRVAALLHDIAKPRTRELRDGEATFYGHERVGAEMADEVLKHLRFSNDERARVTHLIRHHLVMYDDTWTDAAVRRFLQRVGPVALDSLLRLCEADSRAKGDRLGDDLERLARLRTRVDGVVAAGNALTTRDLAIDGNDIQKLFGIPPSRRIGELLNECLERVIEDPAQNTRDALLAFVRTRVTG